MTYAEGVAYLYSLRQFGMKLGLEKTLRLAELAGRPQDRLRFIHVAGTNGKGSTCALLESIYRRSGRKTGLFTSPHLVSFTERIRINGQPVTPLRVARAVENLRTRIESMGEPDPPTFFECVTVMAMEIFAESACDVVIWETGMGGRLDATNIVTPLASLITTIDFDHEAWLGSTLGAIAGEKAGIIKPGVPALTAVVDPEALEVIRRAAREKGSPLIELADGEEERVLGALRPALRGRHQRRNAALACLAVEVLQRALPVTPAVVGEGLSQAEWLGRIQRIQRGERVFWVDGAHNPAGARALRETLGDCDEAGRRRVLIFGALADKDWGEMLRVLAPLFSKVFLVPVGSSRSASPAELGRELEGGVNREICGSLEECFHRVPDSVEVVICGSLYLVGQALRWLQVIPVFPECGDESGLNEWAGRVGDKPSGRGHVP